MFGIKLENRCFWYLFHTKSNEGDFKNKILCDWIQFFSHKFSIKSLIYLLILFLSRFLFLISYSLHLQVLMCTWFLSYVLILLMSLRIFFVCTCISSICTMNLTFFFWFVFISISLLYLTFPHFILCHFLCYFVLFVYNVHSPHPKLLFQK